MVHALGQMRLGELGIQSGRLTEHQVVEGLRQQESSGSRLGQCLLDLGYVAFYAVGAYTYALLHSWFGLSFWPALVLGGIAALPAVAAKFFELVVQISHRVLAIC